MSKLHKFYIDKPAYTISARERFMVLFGEYHYHHKRECSNISYHGMEKRQEELFTIIYS